MKLKIFKFQEQKLNKKEDEDFSFDFNEIKERKEKGNNII